MFTRRLSAITASAVLLSSLAGLLPTSASAAQAPASPLLPYWDATLSTDARAADLLGRMTLDEKVGQMVQAERASVTPEDVKTYALGSVLSGGGSFPNGKQADSTRDGWANMVDAYQSGALSTRLGIPLLYGVDAVHGQNNLIGATLFPHNIGLGATRDPALVQQIGAATAEEVKASGTNWAFAPTIADPQNVNWGRTYEGFGDDQSLVAEMGAAYIRGLQGASPQELSKTGKVVATAKHFLGEGLTDNGTNQGNVSAMTEQQVLDLDLQMYKAAVDAGVQTVMASYNSIQGLKMHANKRLLTDVLKGELGFKGFVVTDYNGVHQIAKDGDGKPVSGLKDQIRVAVNAGVDMLMEPTDWKASLDDLKALVQEGAIPQSRIDDAVTRILRVKFESGVFEHPLTDRSLAAAFGSDAHRGLARKAVAESLVLLKNDAVNGTPILSQLKNMNKIFVAGKSADDIGLQSGGWTVSWQGQAGSVTPGTTILQGIKDTVGSSKTVVYNKHGRGAAGSDVAIAVVGETPYAESNGDGLNGLKLDKEDLATLANLRASGVPTIVVLVSGRPMIVNDQLGDWAGLVEAWLPGTEGEGVADVLFGDADFKGKLPVRWPFYADAYKTQQAGQSNLDPEYILFDYGYGLTKNETTPTLKPAPSLPSQSPYVKVEAENYTAQYGLQAESASDVGGGQDMGYADKGDWATYLINVPAAGTYDVDFRYAVGTDTTTGVEILNEQGDALGKLSVGNTGGWQNWQTATVTGVHLEAGTQTIKLQYWEGSINLNWFGSAGFSPAAIPGGGSGGAVEPQPVVQAGAVENWISSERDPKDLGWYFAPRWQSGDKQLEPQPNLDLTKVGASDTATTIAIDPNKAYQSITGIGTSMEDSTVANLLKMSPAKQDEVLRKLASPTDGIGMSLFRLTIGTADFTAHPFYTYDDMPAGQTDPTLSRFSIQKDIDYGIVDAAKKIQAINPNVKFFASPWSPPGWMKTTDSMIRGQVKDEYLPVLAEYYLKYVQAYAQQGIRISALTLQNEPLLEIDYPSAKMPWQQEAELAKLLRKKLDDAGFGDVLIWIFDHNPSDTMNYPAPLLADPANQAAVDGTAFHDYGGDLNLMSQLHDMYPNENIYLTERAVWGTEGADRIAQYFRNWAKSYDSWVAMLDSDIQMHHWTGTPDPTMLVEDSGDRDHYWATPEYYLLGQFSKFVTPGYTRIDSNYGSKDTVTNVAFLSPDKRTIVTVVINQTDSAQTFKLVSDGAQIAATIPAKSVATYRWNRPGAGDGGGNPVQADNALPGLLQAEQYSAATDGAHADTAGGTDAGDAVIVAPAGSTLDYRVNVQNDGDYPVTYRYAADVAGGDPRLSWTSEDGQPIGEAALTGSAGPDDWISVTGAVYLKAGSQTLHLQVNDAPARLNWIAVGTAMLAQPDADLAEGRVDGHAVTVRLLNDSFVPALTPSNWQVTGLDGVSVGQVSRVDDNTAAIRLSGELAADIDSARTAGIVASVNESIQGSVYGGSSISAPFVLRATDDPESIGVSPTVLDYNIDGQQLTISLAGGTFVADHLADIAISGPSGVSLASASLTDAHTAMITLGWNQTPYFGSVPLTIAVPPSAYADSAGGGTLSASVVLQGGPGHHPDAIAVPGVLGADDYNALSRVTAGGGKLSGFGIGSWADFNIDVPATGRYALTAKVSSPNGGGFQLKDESGNTLASFSIPNLYGSTDFFGARVTAQLPAGAQTIRILGTGAFSLSEIAIEPYAAQPVSSGSPTKIEAEAYLQAGQNVIQYGTINNLGYTAAGATTMDYAIDVAKSGYYKVVYHYATQQGGVSAALLANGQQLASTGLPSTGNWGTYADAGAVVYLNAGEQTVRIVDNGDGFNLDWFQLVPTDASSLPKERIATPTVTVSGQTVILASGTAGAVLHYTTDGTLPDANSPVYTGAIPISSKLVIRAIAMKDGWNDSFAAFYSSMASSGSGGDNGNGNGGDNGNGNGNGNGGDNGNGNGNGNGGNNGNGNGNGGSGNAGTGGNGSGSGTQPVVHAPAPTLDPATGRAVTTIAAKDLNAALEQAKTAANGVKSVQIDVPTLSGQSNYEIVLPAANVTGDSLSSRLAIRMAVGTLVVPNNLLSASDANGSAQVSLTIRSADASGLDAGLRAQIGQRPIVEIGLYAGHNPIAWHHPDAPITVRIPYTLAADEQAEHLAVWSVDDQGRAAAIPNGHYDAGTGTMTFTTTRLGVFAVASVQKTFGDLGGFAWAQSAIEELAAKGIVTGISDSTYSPKANVKRADFIVMLVRALGLTASAQGSFDDVDASSYYADAVGVAKRLGIVKGTGDNRFAPEAAITRQEMMTLAARALTAAGIELMPGTADDLASFADASAVADYAADSVATLAKHGIVAGSGGKISPHGTATRAETAVIVNRIFRLQ